ncbi:spidroin-1-like [Gallus gallus]|uniref:spidroin-1-like n=1 Tax=Gallus gallus TaxID=9031 RepID=UPI001AE4A839|nr:spidroin-1-like [Gallus gallus]
MAGPGRARAQRLGAREREPLPRAAASRTPGEGGGAPHHLPPAARRPMAARALAASLLLRRRRGQWEGGAARGHVGKEGGRKVEGGARGRGFGRGRGRGEGGAGGDVTFAGSFVPPALAGAGGAKGGVGGVGAGLGRLGDLGVGALCIQRQIDRNFVAARAHRRLRRPRSGLAPRRGAVLGS